jgi:hypothetical protein
MRGYAEKIIFLLAGCPAKNQSIMPEAHQFKTLEETIRIYTEVIANFERRRKDMLQRRRGASDSVMVHIDEMLALNQRSLDAFRNVLNTTKRQLEWKRSSAMTLGIPSESAGDENGTHRQNEKAGADESADRGGIRSPFAEGRPDPRAG